jgi:hypothetical protein
MNAFLATTPYLLAILMIITFGVLIFGIVAMGSKRFPPAFRNKLMRVRVAVHAAAILVLLALMAANAYWQPPTN